MRYFGSAFADRARKSLSVCSLSFTRFARFAWIYSPQLSIVDMLASIAFIMGALDQVYVNLFCLLVYALDPPDHNMHVSTIFQPHENKTHNKTRYPAVDENLSSNVFQNIGKQNERTNAPHCTAAIIG
jgi:hypothetical protein